jgi:hypothetical protein
MEIHEGTTIVRSAKLYVYKGKFDGFIMKEDASVYDMFNCLNDVVNELKGLGFNVPVGGLHLPKVLKNMTNMFSV